MGGGGGFRVTLGLGFIRKAWYEHEHRDEGNGKGEVSGVWG